MRSIGIVASGVEICSYDSMVSCQWPNILPRVSALSWSFVVSVRTGVKDSSPQLFQSTWLQNVQISVKLSGVRRKFSWGVSFSGIRWSFVFGVRCLWRH